MRAHGTTGPALVLASAVLWGTAGTVQELALATTSPSAVAATRSAVGGVLLLLWLVGTGRLARLGVTVRDGGRVLLVAVVAMLVFQVGYLEGIRRAGVAVGTLTAIGSAPVWAAVVAGVRRRRGDATVRRPTARWYLATAVAVGGLLLLVAPDLRGGATTVGVVAAALAGAGYATFATMTGVLVARGVDRVAQVAIVFVACGLVLAPTLVGAELGPDPGSAVAGLAWLAVATVAVAYVLFATGMRDVDAPTATTITLAEPLTATVLAVTVVGEPFGPVTALGTAAILVGVALAGGRSGE